MSDTYDDLPIGEYPPDPTPVAGAPETSERDEAIRVANTILDVSRTDPDDDLNILARQFLRLATAPEPSLLAAVERDVMKHVAGLGYKTDGGTEVVARSQVYRVIHEAFESRSPSREAGLDAERLRASVIEALSAVDDEWTVDEFADIVAAEYARLAAASPVTEEQG